MRKLRSLLNGKLKTSFFSSKIKIEAVFQDQKFLCQWRQIMPNSMENSLQTRSLDPALTTDLLDIVIPAGVPIELVKVGFYRRNQVDYRKTPSLKEIEDSLKDPEFMRKIVVMPLYTSQDKEYAKRFLSNPEIKKLIEKFLDQGSLGITFDLDGIHAYLPFPHELNGVAQQIYAILPTLRQIADTLRN